MLRVLFIAVFVPFIAAAQDFPQPLLGAVSDFAQVLTPDEMDEISELVATAKVEQGIQISVATMERIESYGGTAGQSLPAYAKQLFNHWRLGDAERNDGVLVLVVTEDRSVRIALGRGFDAVYDGYAQRAIDTAMLPNFRDGKIGLGIKEGVQSVIDRIGVPFASNQMPAPIAPVSNSNWVTYGIGAVIAVGIAIALFGSRVLAAITPCPQCGKRSLSQQRTVVSPSSHSRTGSGIKTTTCTNCNFHQQKAFTIAMLSSARDRDRRSSEGSSSGDDTSDGGGSSSGGGASGKW